MSLQKLLGRINVKEDPMACSTASWVYSERKGERVLRVAGSPSLTHSRIFIENESVIDPKERRIRSLTKLSERRFVKQQADKMNIYDKPLPDKNEKKWKTGVKTYQQEIEKVLNLSQRIIGKDFTKIAQKHKGQSFLVRTVSPLMHKLKMSNSKQSISPKNKTSTKIFNICAFQQKREASSEIATTEEASESIQATVSDFKATIHKEWKDSLEHGKRFIEKMNEETREILTKGRDPSKLAKEKLRRALKKITDLNSCNIGKVLVPP